MNHIGHNLRFYTNHKLSHFQVWQDTRQRQREENLRNWNWVEVIDVDMIPDDDIIDVDTIMDEQLVD